MGVEPTNTVAESCTVVLYIHVIGWASLFLNQLSGFRRGWRVTCTTVSHCPSLLSIFSAP